MIELRHLETLLAIRDGGSLQEAAEIIGVSHSQVSAVVDLWCEERPMPHGTCFAYRPKVFSAGDRHTFGGGTKVDSGMAALCGRGTVKFAPARAGGVGRDSPSARLAARARGGARPAGRLRPGERAPARADRSARPRATGRTPGARVTLYRGKERS